MVGQVVGADDGRLEAAGRDVDPGDADAARSARRPPRRSAGWDRHETVGAGGIEERLIGGDPRRDDPGHLAAEQPLGRLGVVDLFADGHPAAGGDELGQLRVELVVGEAGHRQGVGALVTAGEREVEQAGGLAGVVAEELVEIAHPEEHQGSRAAGLGRLELLASSVTSRLPWPEM